MLTKQQVEAIKPADKLIKQCDGDILYLFTSPTGKKVWKVLYTFEGKKGIVTLGSYPDLSIKEVRLKRDEIKAMFAIGMTPTQKKQADKIKQLASMSFAELINRYICEIVPQHKGARWETIRLNKIMADFPRLMVKPVERLDQVDMILL